MTGGQEPGPTGQESEAPGAEGDSDGPTDARVRTMVRELRPDWTVGSVERTPYGTDFVATLGVETPDCDRTVVLKATTADLVDPQVARSEPRLLELVGRETAIPVPAVVDYCDDHAELPTPFYLMEHVAGENCENGFDELPAGFRATVVRAAGRNLADLHSLGPLPAAGTVGVRDGELAVLDTDEHPQYDDFRDELLANTEDTLDALLDGGWFPELADDRERFADLVPDLRAHVRDLIPDLPEPDPPTYCHWDYRPGNLILDPEAGETRAVLDWANLAAADPAYNLAKAEARLLAEGKDDEAVTDRLREAFRSTYARDRDGWTFDRSVRERMDAYRLTDRIDSMACLPLWYEDAAPAERDRRETEHRAAVAEYL